MILQCAEKKAHRQTARSSLASDCLNVLTICLYVGFILFLCLRLFVSESYYPLLLHLLVCSHAVNPFLFSSQNFNVCWVFQPSWYFFSLFCQFFLENFAPILWETNVYKEIEIIFFSAIDNKVVEIHNNKKEHEVECDGRRKV